MTPKTFVQNILRSLYRLTIIGLEKGPYISRYYMYKHLSQYMEARPPEVKVLTIRRSQTLAKVLGYADDQITDVSYPDFDLLNLPFADGEFDAVISDQVLEHVNGNPQQAIDESLRVLKPKGLMVHTTCFINPIHDHPHDYWRFTPNGLKILAENKSQIVDVGGWGSPYVWLFVALGLSFEPIPVNTWHPANWVATKNVDRWALSTWILATKPE
jgi:SAM-dependent methyltransferase